MLKEKYKNQIHLIHRLHMLLYVAEMEFIDDVVKYNIIDNKKDALKMTLDIIEYGVLANRIIIKHSKGKVYDKSNFNELSTIIKNNFDEFLDLTNGDYPYHYGIYYTDSWKKELAKIGCWDRSLLKDQS